MTQLMIHTEPTPLKTDADGVVRIGKSRVTLDTIVEAFQEGLTAEEIVQQYPSLNLREVYLVIGYYLSHQEEIHLYLQEREQFAAQVREENKRRFRPLGIRERLLARHVI